VSAGRPAAPGGGVRREQRRKDGARRRHGDAPHPREPALGVRARAGHRRRLRPQHRDRHLSPRFQHPGPDVFPPDRRRAQRRVHPRLHRVPGPGRGGRRLAGGRHVFQRRRRAARAHGGPGRPVRTPAQPLGGLQLPGRRAGPPGPVDAAHVPRRLFHRPGRRGDGHPPLVQELRPAYVGTDPLQRGDHRLEHTSWAGGWAWWGWPTAP